jgi:exoribonuclease R
MSPQKKPYYLCRPSQKELYGRVYYVPYENKIQPKRYVLIEPDPENVKYAKLIQVIGPVGDTVSAEYEHLLYFHRMFQPSWKMKPPEIKDALAAADVEYRVFSIDPHGSLDRDDAFHIKKEKEYYEIGVHIASPTVYFHEEGLDWRKAMQRVSTIYMPHRKINMLPTVYADNICSFLEGEKRDAITILYKLCLEEPHVYYAEPIVCESIVWNQKAYTYEEYDRSTSKKKEEFYRLSSSFFQKSIHDSHLLVEKWMIHTNQYMARYMSTHFPNQCIVRVHEGSTYPKELDDELALHLHRCESTAARYEYFQSTEQTHSLCQDMYTHFTSPIRRCVDLWNHLVLRRVVEDERVDLDFIHSFMKRMRKMQRDSKRIELIDRIIQQKEKRKEYYDAYILEIIPSKWRIYIPEYELEESIRLVHPTLEKELPTLETDYHSYTLYQKIKVEMYIFQEAERFFEKIKWKLYEEHHEDSMLSR